MARTLYTLCFAVLLAGSGCLSAASVDPPGAVGPKAPPVLNLPGEACLGTGGGRTLEFAWTAAGRAWAWHHELPPGVYDAALERPRTTTVEGYAALATAASDAPVIDGLACRLALASGGQGLDPSAEVAFVAAFVQSLEYVQETVGLGFDERAKTPIETLVERGGDCEDTAVLLAALLRAMGHEAVLLLFRGVDAPGHMAVGVALDEVPATPGMGRYTYVETTASGWELGLVPDAVAGETPVAIDIRPAASLTRPTWSGGAWDERGLRLDVSFMNAGSAPADATRLAWWWETKGDARVAMGQRVLGTVPPGETITTAVRIGPPPGDGPAVFVVEVQAENAAPVRADSFPLHR